LLAEEASLHDKNFSKSDIKGLAIVFTGEGKGKTTAALGTVIRALGNGLRVCVVAFMKKGSQSGEWNVLSGLQNIHIAIFGTGAFVDPQNVRVDDKKQAQMALEEGQKAIFSGKYDLVVLDEVNIAAAWSMISVDDVIKLMQGKPHNVEIILTGRYAGKEIIKNADLVTEMLNIKHPYDDGRLARRGIEY